MITKNLNSKKNKLIMIGKKISKPIKKLINNQPKIWRESIAS